MIKSIKIKNKKIGKRILSVFLAVLMCFSCCIPALAFTSSITEWNEHHRFTVNGNDEFLCLAVALLYCEK